MNNFYKSILHSSINNNINNNQNNNINLNSEISIKFKFDNNLTFKIKAKLNEKFEDVVKRFVDNQCPEELTNFSHIAFNSNIMVNYDKNLFDNNIKEGDIISFSTYKKKNNKSKGTIKYSKEENDMISKWNEEYEDYKVSEYFSFISTLPEEVKQPSFEEYLKKDEFLDFALMKDRNLGLEVKEHEHKLIYCLTNFDWKCNVCNKNYNKNIPTFLCSICDYNMCDECREKGMYEKKLSFPKYIVPPCNTVKDKFKTTSYHKHRLVYCRPIRSFLKYSTWKCNKCNKIFEKEIWSYYCSECNYSLCYDNCGKNN